jgi:hypothetical protein
VPVLIGDAPDTPAAAAVEQAEIAGPAAAAAAAAEQPAAAAGAGAGVVDDLNEGSSGAEATAPGVAASAVAGQVPIPPLQAD